MSSIIRVDYLEPKFLVTAPFAQKNTENEVPAGVLRRFNSPGEAIAYAAAVLDGIKIYTTAEHFQPTPMDDVTITPEAAAAIGKIVLSKGGGRFSADSEQELSEMKALNSLFINFICEQGLAGEMERYLEELIGGAGPLN